MNASIIIRTKNEAEFIGETLTRIREQDFHGDYETIIVDSESTDSTVDIVKQHDVTLIPIRQRDFSYGRSLNIGADAAKGRFVVNLSAHAVPRDERWLRNLFAGFEDGKVVGVYGKQLSAGDINPFEALRNEVFFGEEKMTFNIKNRRMLKQIHFSNSNSAIRKATWERFKFDEQAPWAEDILWQKEVIEAGFSIAYAPDAAVYHTHRVCVYDAYRISKDCASSLALMDRKRQSIPMVIYDLGIFLTLFPNSMYQNLKYILKNRYVGYLKISPLYVMSGWFGWLVGRVKYRLKK